MRENELFELRIISSALILEQQFRDKIFSEISEADFDCSIAKEIFKKIFDVYSKFPNADSLAFLENLNSDQLNVVAEIVQDYPSPIIAANQLDDSLKALKEFSLNRKIKSAVDELSFNPEISTGDIKSLAEYVDGLTKKRNFDSADKYIDEYLKETVLLPTSFEKLDDLLNGGFIQGTLISIGARPSTGKTTFAINIATNNPKQKVLFFSLEMSSRMIYDRIISNKTDTSYLLCGKHKIAPETAAAVVKRFNNLTIIDDVFYAEEIAEIINAEKPDLVVVDYMQIVNSKKRFVDNRQRIDYISQLFKKTAKRTEACVIALSQITRGGKDKPTMSDLKESGGLEQDSDYVVLLYREYVNNKSDPSIDKSKTIVTLDKNKFGITGEFELSFDGTRQRFTSKSNEEIQRPKANREEVTAKDDLPF